MNPQRPDQLAGQTTTGERQQHGVSTGGLAYPSAPAQRLRNEESWVEISSQPSSSSLSSIGDEIVTTGLRVQNDSTAKRRRRNVTSGSTFGTNDLARQASHSSQDEYDESESEDDHVMTSSNENIPSNTRIPPAIRNIATLGSESDDDDGNSTALGRVYDEPGLFTPQPNAFSHPPTSQSQTHRATSASYFPRPAPHPSQNRHSYPSRAHSRPQHGPYSAESPSYQADNDAALRASLTTLLSCAHAARGLPKKDQKGTSAAARPEFTGFRLIPESELMAPPAQPASPSTQPRSSSPSSPDMEMGKRKAAGPSKTSTSQSRAVKKKKIANAVEEAMVSPTLLTWVVSAGVVVLVSVVGFGAGYAIGREVGRQEAIEGASCGKEVVRGSGLRKFRWGNGVGISV